MPRQFSASDEFVVWAQSLSGLLTKMRMEYGSPSEMVECASWDESRTEYVLSLVKSLHEDIAQIDEELSRHVTEKFGKDV